MIRRLTAGFGSACMLTDCEMLTKACISAMSRSRLPSSHNATVMPVECCACMESEKSVSLNVQHA